MYINNYDQDIFIEALVQKFIPALLFVGFVFVCASFFVVAVF